MSDWIEVDKFLKQYAQYEDRELTRLRGLKALMEERFSGDAEDE